MEVPQNTLIPAILRHSHALQSGNGLTDLVVEFQQGRMAVVDIIQIALLPGLLQKSRPLCQLLRANGQGRAL